MSPVRLDEFLRLPGVEMRGRLSPAALFPRIAYHSASAKPGELFIALQGERVDGHRYVDDAAKHGAAAALVARTWADRQADPALPLVVADDPVTALQDVARARRATLPGMRVVGITGSVGKTSAKEMIATVLSRSFRTFRNPGNLNSEIGLPLSMLEVPTDTQLGVFEMAGAWKVGELALIAGIGQPRIGVVLNVHPVHLERMGTIERIAESKAELVQALPADGVAVLNGDDPRVRAMAPLCKGRVLTYGLTPDNDIHASGVTTLGLEGSEFWVHIEGRKYFIKIPVIGGHAVELALAAIAVGHALGLHISEMLPGFADASTQLRLIVQDGPNGSQILDDTYNASTPSVLSALSLLDEIGGGRKIAVLGDMRELGTVSEIEHRKVGRRVGDIADVLFTFGDLAVTIGQEAAETARLAGKALKVASFTADELDDVVRAVQNEVQPGDLVLIKGSRGLEMERIVDALRPGDAVTEEEL